MSDVGRVRSIPRSTMTKSGYLTPVKGGICKLRTQYGYWVVGLWDGKGGHKVWGVHQLVLRAFVGLPLSGMECRHINGSRKDNRLENLQWGTKKENAEDRVRHDTQAKGETHGASKLKEADIEKIHQMYAAGGTYDSISSECSVNRITIFHVIHGMTWKHCQPKNPVKIHPRNKSELWKASRRKLTQEQAEAIRAEHTAKKGTKYLAASLSEKYGVSKEVIRKIVNNLIYL